MGCCLLKVVILVKLVGVLLIGGLFWAVLNDHYPPLPDVPHVPATWFGKGKPTQEDPAIRPFKVNFDPKVCVDIL